MLQSDPFIEIEKVSMRYAPRSALALDQVSLTIYKGETFGLVGESGCGKSTLARVLVNLIQDYQGQVLIHNTPLSKTRDLSSQIQIVFQDPVGALNPRKRIGWILEEPLKIHHRGNAKERQLEVEQMLALIGLDNSYMKRYPQELSGGQKQRISIGAALMLKPQFLVADEPVSALDVSVQAQILNLLQALQKKFNLTCLFISHNLDVIYYMCHRVAVMYAGQIIELGEVRDIYNNPKHPYTQELLKAVPRVDFQNPLQDSVQKLEIIQPSTFSGGCKYSQQCPLARGSCRTNAPELILHKNETSREHWVRCPFV